MTEELSDDELPAHDCIATDVVGTTAITPSINAAERALEIAALPVPQAVRGGIYATFMYRQVLAEAVGSVRTVITASGTHTQKDSFRVHLPTRSWPTVGGKWTGGFDFRFDEAGCRHRTFCEAASLLRTTGP